MFHRHRYLILSSLLVAATALLCLFAPEFLLAMEKSSDTGKVLHAKNNYYADDVSDNSDMEFNFQKRLMMLSGQWKSDREVVPEDAELLSEKDLRKICVSIPAMLMQTIDNVNENKDFWDSFIYEEISIALAYNSLELFNLGTEMDADAEDTETRALDNSDTFPGYVNVYYALLFDQGTAKLYKYTDSILGVNNFYLWDYTLESDRLKISYNLKIDAVTLDIYSISIHGNKFDEMGWLDLLWNSMVFPDETNSSSMESLRKYLNFNLDETVLVYPLAYSSLMYKDYQNWNINGVRAYNRGPQGYDYQRGIFLMNVDNAEAVDENIVRLGSGGQDIFACTLAQSGYDFFYTNEESEARKASTNPFYSYHPY